MSERSSYHEEVADLMASSRTVGAHVDRATILAALRAKYPDEQQLRDMVQRLWAEAERTFASGTHHALLVPPRPGEATWELLVPGVGGAEQ